MKINQIVKQSPLKTCKVNMNGVERIFPWDNFVLYSDEDHWILYNRIQSGVVFLLFIQFFTIINIINCLFL